MVIDETCPDCGAERPSWLGSSHYGQGYWTTERHVKLCHSDRQSPEEFFEKWKPGTFAGLGSVRWPELP